MNRRHDERGRRDNTRRSEERENLGSNYNDPYRDYNESSRYENESDPQWSRSQARRHQEEPTSERRYDMGPGDYDSPRGRDYYRGGSRENDFTTHGRSGGYSDSGRYAQEEREGRYQESRRNEGEWNEGPWDRSQRRGEGSDQRYSSGNWNETSNWGPGQGPGSSRSDYNQQGNMSGPSGRERSSRHQSEWSHGYNEPNQNRFDQGHQGRPNADTGYENNYGGFGGYSSGGRGESTSRGGGYNPNPDFDRYDRYSSWSTPGSTESGGGRYRQNWEESGPHSGRGPKNYERSDDKIKDEVCEALTYNGYIDPSDVEVEVEDGKVRLKGTIGSRRDKKMIEDVIDPVRGVRDVRNELEIEEQGSSSSRLASSEDTGKSESSGSNRSKRSSKTS